MGYSKYFVVGTAGTGKTTLCCKLTKQLVNKAADDGKPKHHLVIVSPNYRRDPQLQALAQWCAKNGLTVKVYSKFDKKEGLAPMLNYMDECALQGMEGITYFDDPVGMGLFTASVNAKSPFNSFITGTKHYHTDIIFSTQAIGGMSYSARKNNDVFIYFPDIVSREDLYKACRIVPSQEAFDKLMDKYAIKRHHALWLNVQAGGRGVYAIDDMGQISPITSVP